MRHPFLLTLVLLLIVLLSPVRNVLADPVIPSGILDPKTAPEAWNVIRLATKNVELLLDENRLEEIPVQISYCSPSLRLLPKLTRDPAATPQMEALIPRAFTSVNAIAQSAQQNNSTGAKAALKSLRGVLDRLAVEFDAEVVKADIFCCPMHPDMVSADAKTPCPKCGMPLFARRIPYSFIYTKPGEPSVRMTAKASATVEAGKSIEVTIRMEKADKSPLLQSDLMTMHTQPIHLLIEEPGLGDYHHEHPVATKVPGEYAFAFTPRKTAPYRIWADIVPAATGVQELPFVDLPSTGKAGGIEDTENRLASSAGGYQFALTFVGDKQLPLKAGQTRRMQISAVDHAGKPVTILEPVMNAFAHLVGFYDDYHTVVHLHPTGGDITNPELRGGPSLGFLFYPPKAGFIRLYCQVRIGGKMLFAPFNLNVEP